MVVATLQDGDGHGDCDGNGCVGESEGAGTVVPEVMALSIRVVHSMCLYPNVACMYLLLAHPSLRLNKFATGPRILSGSFAGRDLPGFNTSHGPCDDDAVLR